VIWAEGRVAGSRFEQLIPLAEKAGPPMSTSRGLRDRPYRRNQRDHRARHDGAARRLLASADVRSHAQRRDLDQIDEIVPRGTEVSARSTSA